MKCLLAVYILYFSTLSEAADNATTIDDSVKKLLTEVQKALRSNPDCVADNCRQLSNVNCNQRKMNAVEFFRQAFNAVVECQSNSNSVCGHQLNRINVPDLLFQVSSSPIITCYVNNNDSYFYNANQVIHSSYNYVINEKNDLRYSYEMLWNTLQYKGKFSCYSFGLNRAPIYSRPVFKLDLQIGFSVRTTSTANVQRGDCLNENAFINNPWSKFTVSVNTTCKFDYCNTILNSFTKSLNGNDFGYIFGSQMTKLVGDSLVAKLRSCTKGTATTC